jgi:hypothetical protein
MTNKEKEKSEKFRKAINLLTDKCAKFIKNNGKGDLDIEFFIIQFMLSFDLSYYEVLGILEEAKLNYREIVLGDD